MTLYLWVKSFHIIFVITWMAGLFYLPRLYAYHAEVKVGSNTSELFKVMERKLLKIIINPSMILSYFFGVWLIYLTSPFAFGWIYLKLLFILVLTLFHVQLAKHLNNFKEDKNVKSGKYFRMINEIPSVCLIVIVIMVVLKPF